MGVNRRSGKKVRVGGRGGEGGWCGAMEDGLGWGGGGGGWGVGVGGGGFGGGGGGGVEVDYRESGWGGRVRGRWRRERGGGVC